MVIFMITHEIDKQAIYSYLEEVKDPEWMARNSIQRRRLRTRIIKPLEVVVHTLRARAVDLVGHDEIPHRLRALRFQPAAQADQRARRWET